MRIIAQTLQFIIRPYQPEDEEPYMEMLADPRVNIHLPKRSEEECRRYFHESMQAAAEPFNRWTIVTTAGHYLGMCMLRYIDGMPEGELAIGYSLQQAYWGKGIASAVVAALCAYGFGFASTQLITAVTTPDNIASQKVLLKAGFTPCGEIDDHGDTLLKFKKQRPDQ